MSNRIRFTIDFAGSKIVGTETSLNKAKRYGSTEYKELCKLMKAHPQFEVVVKDVKHSTGKKTYKNLSYDFIEKYISIQPDSDAITKEYLQVKKVAVDFGFSVYPYTKKWFLKRFSTETKPFDMQKAINELKAAGMDVARFEAAQTTVEA